MISVKRLSEIVSELKTMDAWDLEEIECETLPYTINDMIHRAVVNLEEAARRIREHETGREE